MRSQDSVARSEAVSEIDLRALGAAIKRRRRAILLPTLAAFVLVAIFVNVVTPRYTAETQVLLENQESFFTRPDRVSLPVEQTNQLDPEAVASQVQLINSRDIARRAIKQLHLAGDAEFDPLAGGLNPLTRVMVLLGIGADPTRESADSRIVTKFLEKLAVYSPPKTRVITIQFTSSDPDLAARAANVVAQLYLQEQSAAKRGTAHQAADPLSAQITDLRNKLAAADAEREQYRLTSGLLAGSNSMTISGQQLADINSDLSKARSSQADAQAKAQLIRELIRAGKATDVSDVINNDIVRRVSDQRFAAQAQLARESRTLLAGHPRIKELAAQLAEYDLALKQAAKQAAVSLENEAKIAGQRVVNLEAVLTQQKKVAGVANSDEVRLHALDRIVQSYKDQLESSTTKYQEALARETSLATPSDARVISGASRPQEPSFPKKVPFIVFGTVATLVFSLGFVVASELLSGRASVEDEAEPVVVPRRAMPMHEEHEEVATPALRPNHAWALPEEPPVAELEPEPDPVFSPVAPSHTRPSVENLRAMATGGMLAATFAYLKSFGRSAAESRAHPLDEVVEREGRHDEKPDTIGWDDEDRAMPTPRGRDVAPTAVAEQAAAIDTDALAEKIVAAHVPGRGLHIVGTAFGRDSGPATLIKLGRTLSAKGRAIIVDLNRVPRGLAALAATGDGAKAISTMHGLAELLAGDSTFAEVIHRDHDTRLHFIPTGLQEADFRDFDLILDALSETYDFIILLTPDVEKSEIARIMAPYADFVVLAVETPGDKAVTDLEAQLIEAGAREVLVAGPAKRKGRREVA